MAGCRKGTGFGGAFVGAGDVMVARLRELCVTMIVLYSARLQCSGGARGGLSLGCYAAPETKPRRPYVRPATDGGHNK